MPTNTEKITIDLPKDYEVKEIDLDDNRKLVYQIIAVEQKKVSIVKEPTVEEMNTGSMFFEDDSADELSETTKKKYGLL